MAYLDERRRIVRLKIVVDDTNGISAVDYVDYVKARTNPDAEVLMDQRAAIGRGCAMRVFELVPMSLGTVRGFRISLSMWALAISPDVTLDDWTLLYRGADGAILLVDEATPPHRRRIHDETRAEVANRLALGPIVRRPATMGTNAGVEPRVDLRTGAGVFDVLKSVTEGILVEITGRA